MGGLFNLNSILLHILNTAILFAAVYFLLYKPVRKFLKAREEKVSAQLEAGREAAETRDEMIAQGRQMLEQAQQQAVAEAADNARQAQQRRNIVIEEANAEAQRIIEHARREAEHIVESTRSEMVEEAARLAVEMAGSILRREISDDDQRRLVSEFLEKVE